MEKISFKTKCTTCEQQIQFQVDESLCGKTVQIRCNKCGNLMPHQLMALEQVQTIKKRMVESQNKEQLGQTIIGGFNSKEKTTSFFLEIQENELTAFQRFELHYNYYSIGRFTNVEKNLLPDIAIKTNDTFMSKKHAVIKKHANGKYAISDSKSTNKVFVNNLKLEDSDEIILKNGAEIRLGKTIIIFKSI